MTLIIRGTHAFISSSSFVNQPMLKQKIERDDVKSSLIQTPAVLCHGHEDERSTTEGVVSAESKSSITRYAPFSP